MEEINEKKCDEIAVKNFVRYLQFSTVHPNPNYREAVSWILGVAKELDLKTRILEISKDNPFVLLEWTGRDTKLPAILCNSHMDVVAVYPEKWSFPPFEAQEHEGKIYARGSQDMKCVGIQQLESVRRLKMRGIKQLLRTVYICFAPDEELGGLKGWSRIINGDPPDSLESPNEFSFHDLNIGVYLDEGLASPQDEYIAYYNERATITFYIVCSGDTGHSSIFVENNAVEKALKVMNKLQTFRNEQENLLKTKKKPNGDMVELGDVCTLNITILEGGVQFNVVPAEVKIGVNIRVPPTVNCLDIESMVIKICHDVDPDIAINVISRKLYPDVIHSQDSQPDTPCWNALKTVCDKRGIKLSTKIFQGATDGRYLRSYHKLITTPEEKTKKPIEVINFSPMRNTPVLLHDHDEYLSVQVFVEGCRVYADFLNDIGELSVI